MFIFRSLVIRRKVWVLKKLCTCAILSQGFNIKEIENLSIIQMSFTVELTSSPPSCSMALATVLLRDCKQGQYIAYNAYRLTSAARSTFILEKVVRYTCSYLSLGLLIFHLTLFHLDTAFLNAAKRSLYHHTMKNSKKHVIYTSLMRSTQYSQ